MSHRLRLSLLTCAFCLSFTSSPVYAAKTAAKTSASPPASKNWAGMMMTALVVTSTIGGIAYRLGYGQGRSKSDHIESDLPEQSGLSKDSSLLSVEASCPSLSILEITRLTRLDTVAELIQALQSPDPRERRKAIWDLGQQGDSRAVQPLVDLMMDSDSSQRSLILAAVSEIGIKTLKPMNRALMLSLQDSSPDVRKNGIRDVTRIYDLVGQVSQLLQRAAGDSDQEVQETASWALTQLNRIRPLLGGDELHRLPSRLSFKELKSVGEKAEG